MDKKMSERLDGIFSQLGEIEPSEGFCLRFSENLKREALSKGLMAGLGEIEPSPEFNAEFKRMLESAAADKERETVLAKAARVAQGVLSFELVPRNVVRGVTMISAALVIAAGLIAYSMNQENPALSFRKGEASVRLAGRTGWTEINNDNMKFKTGDTIKTGPAGTLDISVSGKYAIRVKPGAEVTIKTLPPKFIKGTAEFELLKGQVLISIEKGFKGSKFFMNTGAAQAMALGTKFSVGIDKKETTDVKVLEGTVEVKGTKAPEGGRESMVLVRAGQKTGVAPESVPTAPKRMAEADWKDLEELYQIGSKAQVVLLINNSPERTLELLKPCAIYISDTKPREIPRAIETALSRIYKAIKSGKKEDHLEAIHTLEGIIEKHPNPKYDVQFLLYIGAYYRYIGMYDESIKTFENIVSKYPGSSLSSMALCAIGYIYEHDLHDEIKAIRAYDKVVKAYPYSLEAIWLEEKPGSQL